MITYSSELANTQNGPIGGTGFDKYYDNSAINVMGAQPGALTSGWDSNAYKNYPWGTGVSIWRGWYRNSRWLNGLRGSD